MRVIKRYENRKLYDTVAKQYVSLDGIAALIRNGADVQVLDHGSGEDVTTLILAQIIAEEERRQVGLMPRSVLAGLVRAGDQALSGLREGLASPLEFLRHVDEEIERRIRRLVESGELGTEDGARLSDLLTSPRRWTQEADELVRRAWSRYAPPSRADLQTLSDRLDALAREVEALSRQE